MAKPRLVSFDLCPFVQRSVVALEALGIDYELEHIDLTDKPDWFLEISPFGRVPVLVTDEGPLFESSAILEFLNETVAAGKLLPASAHTRAVGRAWIRALEDLYLPNYHLYSSPEESVVREAWETCKAGLAKLEGVLGDGPWFFGDEFSMVECVAAPVFARFHFLTTLAPDFDILGEDLPKVSAWAKAILAHPAVKASMVENIEARFRQWAHGEWGVNRMNAPKGWIVAREA